MCSERGAILLAMKEKSKTKEISGRDYLARVIAVGAFVLSILTFWFNTLSPADIKTTLSSPTFQWENSSKFPVSRPWASNDDVLGMDATVGFANKGAQSGQITRLAVVFTSDDGTQWTFLPYKVIDDTSKIPHGNNDIGEQFVNAPGFSGIVIPGKQTTQHTYLFLATEFKTLDPHKFHVKLLTWADDDSTPRQQQVFTLDLDQHHTVLLQQGGMVGARFEEEKAQIRNIPK